MRDDDYPGTKWECEWHDLGMVSKAMWLVHGKNCPRVMHSQKVEAHFEGLFTFILRILGFNLRRP